MDVANPSAAHLPDLATVALDHVEIAQIGFARDRQELHAAGPVHGRLAIDGELDWPIGLVTQQAIWAVVGQQVRSVHLQHVVPRGDVDADFSQRRSILGFRVVSSEDCRDAVPVGGAVQLEFRAGQRDARALGGLPVTAGDVRMTDRQLGNHLAHDVIQIGSVCNVFEKGAVPIAERPPVVPVHVLDVEEVAKPPPHLVEDLPPLLGRNPIDHQAARRHVLGLPVRLGVEQLVGSSLPHEHLGPIARERVARDVGGERCSLPIAEREDLELRHPIRVPPVVVRTAAHEEQLTFRGAQAVVVVARNRHPRDAMVQAIEIDADRRRLVRLLSGLRLRLACGLLFRLPLAHRDFIALGRERMRHVLAQRHCVDGRFPIDDIVPFERIELRRVLAIRQEIQILALRIPRRAELVEELVGDTLQRSILEAPDVDGSEIARVGQRKRQIAAIG